MMRIILTLGVLVAFAACSDGTTPDLLAPDDAALARNNVVASATGSGHATFNDAWRTFSFTARTYADGSAAGQYQLHNRIVQGHFQTGGITCMSVVGNTAWVAGTIDRSYDPDHVGRYVRFIVVDNGEGGAVDQISWMYPSTNPGADLEFCANMYTAPLHEVEAGNIQVRGTDVIGGL